MYCKRCAYSLHGLQAGQCPECAHPFDPAAPATFDAKPRAARLQRTLRLLFWSAAAWPWLTNALAFFLLVLARLVLGHWPHRMGLDDPKGIPLVKLLVFPLAAMMLGLPLSLAGHRKTSRDRVG